MGRAVSFVLSLVLVVIGLTVLSGGIRMIGLRSAISAAYAAIGDASIVLGAIALAGGLGTLATLGRRTLALRIGGGAACCAGLIYLAGVLTDTIPCSGPDRKRNNLTSGGGIAIVGLVAALPRRSG